jgi:hypothetical protein
MRVLVVFVESVCLAAALLLLAESLGWHVLSEADGVAADVMTRGE